MEVEEVKMVLRKCPRCKGRGKLSWDDGNPFGGASIVGMFLDALTGGAETCPLCKGRGYIDDGTIEMRGRHEVHWYDE